MVHRQGLTTQLRYITRETAAYLYYRWFGESPRASLGAV
jgi:hypothetical protein